MQRYAKMSNKAANAVILHQAQSSPPLKSQGSRNTHLLRFYSTRHKPCGGAFSCSQLPSHTHVFYLLTLSASCTAIWFSENESQRPPSTWTPYCLFGAIIASNSLNSARVTAKQTRCQNFEFEAFTSQEVHKGVNQHRGADEEAEQEVITKCRCPNTGTDPCSVFFCSSPATATNRGKCHPNGYDTTPHSDCFNPHILSVWSQLRTREVDGCVDT
jgi:hypothetical protein